MASPKSLKVLFSEVPGARKLAVVELTLPNPYVAGGIAILASEVQMSGIKQIVPFCTNSPLYDAYWDNTNNLVQVAVSSTGAEAGAIDLSLIKVYCLVIGY